jgi:hypothetical protein
VGAGRGRVGAAGVWGPSGAAGTGDPSSRFRADISILKGALPAFLDVLAGCSRGLPADELTRLDRVVERKLWELDRADVHAVTGGSADGFLYSRGFVVAMGREFCDAVTGDPERCCDRRPGDGRAVRRVRGDVLFLRTPM